MQALSQLGGVNIIAPNRDVRVNSIPTPWGYAYIIYDRPQGNFTELTIQRYGLRDGRLFNESLVNAVKVRGEADPLVYDYDERCDVLYFLCKIVNPNNSEINRIGVELSHTR